LAIAGPRRYGGEVVDDAVMGDGGRRAANAGDIRRALTLYRIADGLLIGLVAVAAGLWYLI
ncbi:cobalamin biosynthesis protein, partial [Nitratireductor aquimarinus]|nr:cobalamin biosynthesis protein [Nitratireductor aquimarinus]